MVDPTFHDDTDAGHVWMADAESDAEAYGSWLERWREEEEVNAPAPLLTRSEAKAMEGEE